MSLQGYWTACGAGVIVLKRCPGLSLRVNQPGDNAVESGYDQ